jgi:hypothetical protein
LASKVLAAKRALQIPASTDNIEALPELAAAAENQ